MQSTHTKGLIGEIEFTLHYLNKGYQVLKPTDPNSAYDLVLEKDGIFTRVQIKYLTPIHNILRLELIRPMRKTASYRERQVDAFGIFEPTHKKFYLVPINKIKTKTNFWLRISKPNNGQKIGVHLAKEFEV